ncbi:glyoxalase [Amycolatopsis antarctica]|uniref:Glyoxalase n=1 Tax=Amycolatopsis antarctica TaxID=1854586 RepID=A0A263D2F2_9PSEU|nr:VOC family protein [Amycolatopsis antarctica]OZM72531.1 glyoxalase [Amycolatopsis antarctica]
MTGPYDNFDALHRPAHAIEPDPEFASALKERLRAELLTGGDMTTTEISARMHALTPYLVVTDARAAIEFYVEVFGASRRAEPIVMPDGKVGHAEVAIGDSVLMMAEEFPEMGNTVAPSGGPLIRVEVSDVDRVIARAGARGVEVDDRGDTGHGRSVSMRDPFGQRWLIAQAPPPSTDGTPGIRHGEAGYFTFQVPDDTAAKAFYGAVLGWQFSPGSVEGGWAVEGNGVQGGLWGGPGRQVGWKLMYAVDDLAAALERVRAHGGTAGEPERQPYGLSADCADDQGIEFWLWEQPANPGA